MVGGPPLARLPPNKHEKTMGMALIPWWGPALPALIEILAQITWKSAAPAPEFGPKNIISEGQYYHRESIQRVSANSGVYRKV